MPGSRQVGQGEGEEGLTPLCPARAPEKETVSRAVAHLARARGHLWAHSLEPLRQPLLQRVHATAELRDAACQIFIDILLRRLAGSMPHRGMDLQGLGRTGLGQGAHQPAYSP